MKTGFKFQYTIISFLITCLIVLTIRPSQLLAAPTPPDIHAESAILMDAKTGTVLFEKNANERQYPASITKIMTSLLAIENLNPTDVITFSHDAIFSIERNSSRIGLDVGEQITVDQALHALLLMSANEVANGLAEKVSGSIDNFAALMTNKAKELGAQNTHFVNPHGLHDKNHYTTAYDMALITRAIYNNEYFLEIMSTPIYQIPPTNKTSEIRGLSQQHGLMNQLRNSYMYREDVIGGKTGYTDIARQTLVTTARKNDIDLIVVILKGESHEIYKDTNALLDYGFDSYKSLELHTPNDTLARLPIYSIKSGKLYEVGTSKIGVRESKNIIVETDLKRRELITQVDLPEYLEIGIQENDVVGTITYIDKGKTLTQSELIVSAIDFTPAPYKANYPPISPTTSKLSLIFSILIGIILFIIVIILLVRLKSKNKFKHKKLKFSKTIK
ncbi:MAG: D-alanyl-D-alanine carboxypeptidase family protein [Cellulosilyticaceae bacterium]